MGVSLSCPQHRIIGKGWCAVTHTHVLRSSSPTPPSIKSALLCCQGEVYSPLFLVLCLVRGRISSLNRWQGAREEVVYHSPPPLHGRKGVQDQLSILTTSGQARLCPHQQGQHYYGAQVKVRACSSVLYPVRGEGQRGTSLPCPCCIRDEK